MRKHYPADANRIGVTGVSSGAMMTNVMLGVYPDVFRPAQLHGRAVRLLRHHQRLGVEQRSAPAARSSRTPQQWGDLVRNGYPGYTGTRPRMQIWHGTTDTTLRYPNFGEQIKQWTNVLGVSPDPQSTDYPQSGWTRTRYGDTVGPAPVEAISIQGDGTTPSRSTPRGHPLPRPGRHREPHHAAAEPDDHPAQPDDAAEPADHAAEPDHDAAEPDDDSAGYGWVFGVGVVEFVDGWFRGHGEGDRGFLGYAGLDGEHDSAGWDECDRYVVGVGQW